MSNHEGFSDPTADQAVGRVYRMYRPYQAVGGKYRSREKGVVPLVYICSRFSGKDEAEVTEHIRLARLYSRFALTRQAVPVTPHLLYPQFLRDEEETERNIGIQCGLKLLLICDELWVFATDRFSEGMRLEIQAALKRGMRIRCFDEKMREVVLDECSLQSLPL